MLRFKLTFFFTMTFIKTKFEIKEYVVYPGHGIGKIIDIKESIFSGNKIKCYIIKFDTINNNTKNLILHIPKYQAKKSGMRPITPKHIIEKHIYKLCKKKKEKIHKEIWNKRIKEYEKKINSGNIQNIVEVLKELKNLEKSYSEKVLFEQAINMLSLEYSISIGIEKKEAKKKILSLLCIY